MPRSTPLIAFGLALSLGATACQFSREIAITSDPDGAHVWLGRESIGATPARFPVSATGPIENQTFKPEYVTVRMPGYREEVRQIPYRWSGRNVIWSIPLVLGVPGILLWAKVPHDMHVVLEPEAEPSAD